MAVFSLRVLLGVFSLAAALPVAPKAELYSFDDSWKPRFPAGAHSFSAVGVAYMGASFPWDPPKGSLVYVTQRGNASIDPVLVMNATDGALVNSWGKEFVGLDYTKTPSAPTWGAHGLAVENCNYPCESSGGWYAFMRVYVDDFTNHTLTAFTGDGKKVLQLGTNGVAGTGTSPLQFGSVADSAIQTGYVPPSPSPGPSPSYIYSSDGDGGTANRVVKVQLDLGHEASVSWATKSIYDNPHSIAFHQKSNLVIIANRGHNETRLLRASDGEDLGAWNCGIDYGKDGKPFGVRTLQKYCSGRELNLIIVAIMDNPQDGLNQKIVILDGSDLNEKQGTKSKCSVLQEIKVDTKYSGPHLLGVDDHNGDIYAALVSDQPMGTVLRYNLRGCDNANPIQV